MVSARADGPERPDETHGEDASSVAEHAAVLVWSADAARGCTWCDEAWLRFTGRTLEAMLGDGWLDVLHADDRPRCVEARRAAFAAGVPIELEYRLRRADGAYRSVLERAEPRGDDHGRASYLGSCLDVTDVRWIAGALAVQSGQRAALADLGRAGVEGEPFPRLSQRATDLVLPALAVESAAVFERVAGDELVLRAASGFTRDLVGRRLPIDETTSIGATVLRESPLLVKDWADEHRFPPAAARAFGIRASASVALGSPRGPVGVLVAQSAAPRVFSADDVNFLRNVAHVLGAALAGHRDQAERDRLLVAERTARAELEETVARLDTLLEHAPVAFAFFDREFRFVRVNEALTDIDGVAVSDHLGRTVADVLPAFWPQLERLFRRVLDTEQAVVGPEFGGLTQGDPGRERFFSLSVYPVRGASGSTLGLGALALEITERKRAELAAGLVARALQILANAEDIDAALDEAVGLAIPDFADSCHLYYQPKGAAARVAIAHRDAALQTRLEAAHERWPLDLEAIIPRHADTGEPRALLLEPVDGATQARLAAGDADQLQLVEEHGVTSAVLAPLLARGEPLGLLVLNYTHASGRRYRVGDVALAEALAQQLADGLEAARLGNEARRAQSRVDLLARAGELVVVELDTDVRLARFTALVVPDFADCCVVNMLEDDGSFRLT
ncbi:MAG TPA: PAS domain-containing protein, partial [Acidimicrobiia bacterium]|nr:PAS domain-containing protein [Acidimicrobiia bacterium]